MDHINFSLVDSSFDNLDLNVFSSTKEETDILSSIKEEMDARKGNFSFIMKNKKKGLSKVFFIDLDVYRRNGTEEQTSERFSRNHRRWNGGCPLVGW